MKTFQLLSLALLCTLIVACSANDKPAVPVIQKATVQLPTLKCNSCVRHIKHALSGVDGINDVAINLDAKNAEITYSSDKIDLPKIELAIAKSGYDANNVKRDTAAYAGLAECCK